MQRKILEAATEEFANHGYGGARVERISRRARTVDRMLYYYFGSKEKLFRAVLEGAYERLGRADIQGFAPDYAFLVEALLDLYEATFEPRYFEEALRLDKIFEARFADPRGGYFLAAESHDGLIVRPREIWDGATPSSNSVAAMNLLRLAAFTGDETYRRRADGIFDAFSGPLERAPVAFPRLLCALDFRAGPIREIVLSGERGREDFEALRRVVFGSPGAARVLVHADSAAAVPELVPISQGRAARGGRAMAYVCEAFACRAPIAEPEALRAALEVT